MKLRVLLGLALVALAVIPARADKSTPTHPDRIGFDIRISPMQPPADRPTARPNYLASVIVTRLETGEVIVAPTVQMVEGIPAAITSGGGEGPTWKGSFLISGGVATYRVEATMNDAAIFSNSGSIRLENAKTP